MFSTRTSIIKAENRRRWWNNPNSICVCVIFFACLVTRERGRKTSSSAYSNHHQACCLIFRSRMDFILLSLSLSFSSFSTHINLYQTDDGKKELVTSTMHGLLPSNGHKTHPIQSLCWSICTYIHMCVCTRKMNSFEREREWILTELHTFFSLSRSWWEKNEARNWAERIRWLARCQINRTRIPCSPLRSNLEAERRLRSTAVLLVNGSNMNQGLYTEKCLIWAVLRSIRSSSSECVCLCVYTCRRWWWWWMSRWRRSDPSQGETILNKVARAPRKLLGKHRFDRDEFLSRCKKSSGEIWKFALNHARRKVTSVALVHVNSQRSRWTFSRISRLNVRTDRASCSADFSRNDRVRLFFSEWASTAEEKRKKNKTNQTRTDRCVQNRPTGQRDGSGMAHFSLACVTISCE